MPATSTTTFSDPAGCQAGIRGPTINLIFTSPGKFTARLTSVSLPHLKLISVSESLPRIAYISSPSDSVNLHFHYSPSSHQSGVGSKYIRGI